MKRMLFAMLAVLMIFTAACGAGGASITTQPSESGGAFFRSEDDTFAVNTPYCVLRYPSQWENSVKTVVDERASGCAVSFIAEFGAEQVPLFTFEIGDISDGFELGSIETKDGMKTVWMIDHSDELNSELSIDDKEQYMEMCEDVNVIISNLVYEYDMILP